MFKEKPYFDNARASKSYIDKAPYIFPDFELPYSENEIVLWSGGPHAYNKGGDFTGTYTAGEGSGLDFSLNGRPFDVLAMASGEVIQAACKGYFSLGCIVAIKHDVGGTVIIYAHLEETSTEYVRYRFNRAKQAGVSLWAPQGVRLGKAGNTGMTEPNNPIHLHIELRDGSSNCYI